MKLSVGRFISGLTNKSVSQSIDQSINQSINQSVRLNQSKNEPFNEHHNKRNLILVEATKATTTTTKATTTTTTTTKRTGTHTVVQGELSQRLGNEVVGHVSGLELLCQLFLHKH
jgi:hypothetical protein